MIGTPARGLPRLSTSFTDGVTGRSERICALCWSPAAAESAGYTVTKNFTEFESTNISGWPVVSTTVAVTEFNPFFDPRVHCVEATPPAPVVATAGETDPPPPVTVNAILAFATGALKRLITPTRMES